MPNDYEYDIFLSYSRKSPVLDWVQNHFYPELKQWLASHTPHEPRIFVDWEQQIWSRVAAKPARGTLEVTLFGGCLGSAILPV